MMTQAAIGLIGLAVMGENLALNMESRGFKVAVFNRSINKVDDLLAGRAQGKNIVGAHSLREFLSLLEKPKRIVLMVKAGAPVDAFIDQLVPLLDKGDIVIDGGNSHYKDSERRTKDLEAKGLLYVGSGISGGEEGALKGPSIMPGGSFAAWEAIAPIFQAIAAKAPDGSPCCMWMGPRGAGHFVKMVHNGIEYGDMQLISEAYSMLKYGLDLSADELHSVFSEWNGGRLDSYLIEITERIFLAKDPETKQPLVDVILDRAGQKGTGQWTTEAALEQGVPAPMFCEAVFARSMSALKNERVAASKILEGPREPYRGDRHQLVKAIEAALYASKICSYAQGFALLREASAAYEWDLKPGEIALIWRAGCIIRSQFLGRIKEAFDTDPGLRNLLLAPYFKEAVQGAQEQWRTVVSTAVELGIPVPAFSSALSYFDSYRRPQLPANLIQAQRDFFGAHTYERTDRDGVFHSDWLELTS